MAPLWVLGAGLLFTAAAHAQLYRADAYGDAVVRRTDPGADGLIDMLTHKSPDVLSYTIGR